MTGPGTFVLRAIRTLCDLAAGPQRYVCVVCGVTWRGGPLGSYAVTYCADHLSYALTRLHLAADELRRTLDAETAALGEVVELFDAQKLRSAP